MSIEFMEKQILDYEKEYERPYVGYFTPNGTLLDFNGEKHSDQNNKIAQDFLTYISYKIGDEVRNGYYNYKDNYSKFISNLSRQIDKIDRDDELKEFEYNLLIFFKRAYSNNDFFNTISRHIIVDDNNLNIKKVLLTNLKDICIQYLGYDSVERFDSLGNKIDVDYNHVKPRLISSSYHNIKERYYNYLLMDWEIQQFPRYNYNEEKGIYELESSIILYDNNDLEEELTDEIKSIRKLIPLDERYKYFR